ncbi:hypothetical protein EJ02DRAFT_363107, partial [Clathrospora elynae]
MNHLCQDHTPFHLQPQRLDNLILNHSLVKIGSTQRQKKTSKTYNSGDSLVVTHLTTNPPVHCLSTAERTGS